MEITVADLFDVMNDAIPTGWLDLLESYNAPVACREWFAELLLTVKPYSTRATVRNIAQFPNADEVIGLILELSEPIVNEGEMVAALINNSTVVIYNYSTKDVVIHE